LPDVFERARAELVIYQAGCDLLEDDPLANLRVTIEGVVRRDELVFAAAATRRVPIVMTLGGGYSPRAWEAQYRSVRNLIERFARGPRSGDE
jgi:acetoin utilization deacetylase AcuC-like enzyme